MHWLARRRTACKLGSDATYRPPRKKGPKSLVDEDYRRELKLITPTFFFRDAIDLEAADALISARSSSSTSTTPRLRLLLGVSDSVPPTDRLARKLDAGLFLVFSFADFRRDCFVVALLGLNTSLSSASVGLSVSECSGAGSTVVDDTSLTSSLSASSSAAFDAFIQSALGASVVKKDEGSWR